VEVGIGLLRFKTGKSIPRTAVALLMISEMWLLNVRFLSTVTPKYLACLDHFMLWPSIWISRRPVRRRLLNMTDTVFWAFTLRRQVLNHSIDKSVCLCSWRIARSGCLLCEQNIVSSANRDTDV